MNLNDLFLVPESWLFLVAFGFGIIIGSFLNVYIYRFHTGKSLSGSSHCLSCGKPLRWFELFPLFSYLALRGKCSKCGCKITPRYFLVELATGLLFAMALSLSFNLFAIFIWWFIFSVLVVITVYDLYHFIIPDELTVALTISVLGLIAYEFYVYPFSHPNLLVDILAALGGSAFFLTLWLVSKGTWLGFGDVKLAIPLGLLVGSGQVFTFVVLSFWIGAAISIVLIGINKLSRGKEHLHLNQSTLTMKSAVPFAPFLVASALVILFTNFNALQLFSHF